MRGRREIYMWIGFMEIKMAIFTKKKNSKHPKKTVVHHDYQTIFNCLVHLVGVILDQLNSRLALSRNEK